MQRYILSTTWNANLKEVTIVSPCPFRPTNIKVHLVQLPGVGYIDGIYVAGDKHSQLLGAIDAYQFTQTLWDLQWRQFIEEYKLVGKSDHEVQAYMDEHDLSVPDPSRIDLPTLQKGQSIRFTGAFKIDSAIALVGWA